MKPWQGLATLLNDRWQLPLAVVAAGLFAFGIYQMRPPKRTVPFETLLAEVHRLADAGLYFDAADAAANLLELDPPLPPDERGRLHDALADIIYEQELLRAAPNPENARTIIEHHQQAIAFGQKPEPRTLLRAGQAYEWLGEIDSAIAAFRSVIQGQPTAEARRTAWQALVGLLEDRPTADEERRGYIQALLDEHGVSTAYLWWALQHAVREALDHDDDTRARDLLTNHGERFQRSDMRGYYDYLWALVHIHAGDTASATPLLDRADEWLAVNPRADAELDKAGFLPAMTRWLRGQIHLAEARPQRALAYFDEALVLQSHGLLLVDASAGRASALALLERHVTARETIRQTLAQLETDLPTLAIAEPRMRATVWQLFQDRHDRADYANAVDYLQLALELSPEDESSWRLDVLEQLGTESELAAREAQTPEERRTLSNAAAEYFEQSAELAQMDESRRAALLWGAARQYDAGGRPGAARRMLEAFVEGRTLDPRLPQALLQLGQAYAAEGLFPEAIERYRKLVEDYRPLTEASRARLRTANCLVAMGPEHEAEAEGILLDLLSDEFIAPSAEVFRDALFSLCDLYYRQERYADAIGRMEDFLIFYPENEAAYRIRFLLADSYRRSAYALRDDAAAGEPEARAATSRERFARAADLFGDYTEQAASVAAPSAAELDQRAYNRLALFYRGDCLFELNTPEALEEAIKTYDKAAATYHNESAALTAKVQIANIYLRQGKVTEAARAVENARWLLRNIPDRVFAEQAGGMDRAGWDEYLNAIRHSQLFQGVLADAQ